MKSVLITGASRGIGRATALKFAQEGYATYLTCSNSMEQLHNVKEEIDALGSAPCYIFRCDAKEYSQVESLFKQLPPLDVVVNNAGIAYYGLLQDMTPEEWHHLMATNLDSCFYTSKFAIPLMLKNSSGRILNISSVWGNVGASMETAYSASKGAINSFTKALAKELAPSNIQVNALACGIIDTDMNRCFSEDDLEALIQEIPACRLGKPEEAALMASRILSAPEYMTGQIITMDGGWI
jgi:3-oxoacyl-[acyl-carrier protein] reductase